MTPRPSRRYGYSHITNVQFSTESLISDVCKLVERIRYEAYGRARHSWPEDLDEDGTYWFIDRNIALDHISGSAIGDSGSWPAKRYNVLMDLDFSGTIEQDEYDAIQNNPDRAALPAGRISDADFASGPWSPIGYDGYVYDDAADMSAVRFRWYDAKLGRWVSRDPAGYVEHTLYSYAMSDPGQYADPHGLWPKRFPQIYHEWLTPTPVPHSPNPPPPFPLTPKTRDSTPRTIVPQKQPPLLTWRGCPRAAAGKGFADVAQWFGDLVEGHLTNNRARYVDAQLDKCINDGKWPILYYVYSINLGPRDLQIECASDPCAAKERIRDTMIPFYRGWDEWENGYYFMGRDYWAMGPILHPHLRDWRIYELMRKQLSHAGRQCYHLVLEQEHDNCRDVCDYNKALAEPSVNSLSNNK
ncbi:MAG: hypothetical protein KF866_12065 [Phycisphaeraceae bacterium]|nr:hypothetical protein [Phycisphaeraceae bacterium]